MWPSSSLWQPLWPSAAPAPREVREGDQGSQGRGQRERPGLGCPRKQVSRRATSRGPDRAGSRRDGDEGFCTLLCVGLCVVLAHSGHSTDVDWTELNFTDRAVSKHFGWDTCSHKGLYRNREAGKVVWSLHANIC